MTDRNKRWFGLFGARISQGVEKKAPSEGENPLLALGLSDPMPGPLTGKTLPKEPTPPAVARWTRTSERRKGLRSARGPGNPHE